MSRNRTADAFKVDEVVYELRQKIKSKSAMVARLVHRIGSATGPKRSRLLADLKGTEAQLKHLQRSLKGALSIDHRFRGHEPIMAV